MLRDLVAGLPISTEGDDRVEVFRIEHDSRRVAPGDLFVAIPGERYDGRRFVGDAVGRGAVAVLATGAPDAGRAITVPWLATHDPRAVLGPLSARVSGHPERQMTVIGVTGTNGKSTVVGGLARVLEAAGRPCGVVGTLGTKFRGVTTPPGRTTPEAPELFRTFADMRSEGAEAISMEVSSHAIVMGRVGGLSFDLAVFTNLSHDHLDFHGDLESYFEAKRQVFLRLTESGRVALNVDDPFGRRLLGDVDRDRVVTFGAEGDVRTRAAELGLDRTRVELETPAGSLDITTRLVGRYNLENVTAIVAGASALGIDRAAIGRGLASVEPLEGRMERVDCGQEMPVFVDFAHTPAALTAAIEATSSVTGRPVVVVFGCGGDRDRAKRSEMGRVAGDTAARVVLTSDNPRSEDPMAILDEVETGLRASAAGGWEREPDRRRAIRRGVEIAAPGSALLVAGKGHESYQILGDRTVDFSDRRELELALRDHGAGDDA